MAARGYFRARFLLYCFKRNSRITETVFTSTTSVIPYIQENVFQEFNAQVLKAKL